MEREIEREIKRDNMSGREIEKRRIQIVIVMFSF